MNFELKINGKERINFAENIDNVEELEQKIWQIYSTPQTNIISCLDRQTNRTFIQILDSDFNIKTEISFKNPELEYESNEISEIEKLMEGTECFAVSTTTLLS